MVVRQILPTGPDYLVTPMRRHAAMDHDFYPWRDTWAEPRLDWRAGVNLGVWIQMAVEWFPLNISGEPFLPIGGPDRPWPDSETYTQRDYGLRVGIYRLMDALGTRNIPVSAFLNARVAQRYPILMREIMKEGWEIVASGLDADALHHEGLDEETERSMIAETLAIIEGFGVTPVAWHSTSWSQSTRTPDLLREAGIGVMADWCNDEAPHLFETRHGPLVSLPSNLDLTDRDMIGVHKFRQAEYENAVLAAARRLLHEAEDGATGRLLPLNVSPWLMGQPYRIATFERILDTLSQMDGVGFVCVPDILEAARDRP